jgi:predicted N-acyltransferase
MNDSSRSVHAAEPQPANSHKRQRDLTHRIFSSLDTVCLDAWNQVRSTSRGDIGMDPRLLRALEATMSDVSQFWYIIMYDKAAEPVACAVLTTFPLDLAVIAGAGTQRLTNLLRRIFPSLLRVTVLFCGLPLSVGQKSLLIAPAANPHDVILLLDSIAQEIAARENARLIIFKEFRKEDTDHLDTLMESGYRMGDSLDMHYFPYNFPSFAEYKASLRHPYRKIINRSRRKFEERGLHLVRYRDPQCIKAVYTRDVHQLYEAVFEKAEHKLERLPRKFFIKLAQQFPGDISLTALYYQEQIVAFGWALSTGQTYHLLYCGLDYAVNEQFDLYFNVMYAELDHGLREGVTDIKLGQTADTFKVQLGCKQQPLYFYIKGAGFLWDVCIKAVFSVLFPRRPLPPTYKVFKDKQ